MFSDSEPVLIVSPRYADDLAAMTVAAGQLPRIERRPDVAAARFAAEPMRVVVVDARGALTAGLAAARALGPLVDARRGAMLVLLSRGDVDAAGAANEAGATSVMAAPFGSDTFANALALAGRHAARLAVAAAAPAVAGSIDADSLTGLASGDRVQRWLAEQRAAGQPAGVIVVGVGRFAQINSSHGRDVADRLLAAIGRRLAPIADADLCKGEVRLLGRLTAAEFAVGVSGAAAAPGIDRLAALLLAGFERPFAVDDRVIHVSGRAGVAWDDGRMAGEPSAVAVGLLREAAIALADARSREPGAVARFRDDTAAAALALRVDLESDLFRALDDGDIVVLFQPLVRLSDGVIGGVEALVRWDHPLHGRLPAAVLLETAISAELAIKLGRHIRTRAISRAAAWTGRLAHLKLSLNVTAADLADPQFVDTLAVDLAQAGLSPHRLVIEVTEEAVIFDMDAAAATLSLLRRDGVGISLDDFGAGYSSLARLARLPVDTIKLDRSFAAGLTGSERERIVVEGMIATARRLGMAVVAEGVEDDVQLAAARAAGCDWVQGFCMAPPLDEAELAAFCSRKPTATVTKAINAA
ncbi:GGDEF domain-containing phosphodiesterase [Sandarakinorhabdus sp.]|uniref:putative bifunctional diguanylate cyclase/phosphodiesterase n=1 Tax=Sandarakinorhabdus sp. TaxID=1916663 RepID=UPI0033407E2E